MSLSARHPAMRKHLQKIAASLILCGPAVVLYGGFIVFPAILGFAYSLTNWNGWVNRPRYIGLTNFRDLISDTVLPQAIRFTLFETLLIVVFFSFGSMLLAILLDKLKIMKGLIRGLFFYPYILSILVGALLFQYMANFREGAVNTLLRAIGLGAFAQDWMGDTSLVAYFIFALVAWNGLGFFTTVYLANLQTIPTDLYEAARIDGAGALTVFTRIQFPMLLPTLTTNSVLALITGINLFPQIVVTTQGGPGWRTFTVGYYIYYLGVLNNRQGYAAAVSFVTFVALVGIAGIQVALLRRRQVAL
jgi:ABC-type sugar transport system permease subunit